MSTLTIEHLWQQAGFEPNEAQRQAILQTEGPVFLTAGPGSGKTRVLLWRTLNLIVFHKVEPEKIFLSTFTEKAARQLKEGLKNYLGQVTNLTDQPYDIARMYVGTTHALCRQLIHDKKLIHTGTQNIPRKRVEVLDELRQYFFFAHKRRWREMLIAGEFPCNTEEETMQTHREICTFFKKAASSRHEAITQSISFFNRLSEECADAQKLADDTQAQGGMLHRMLKMYQKYLSLLMTEKERTEQCDFSLLQQKAFNTIEKHHINFHYVIIDEYQDTNTIQEKIFFNLAAKYKNICVVGDDDQALYRFRGATVENFVQFPERCKTFLDTDPVKIPLSVNYRSRRGIVDFYTRFIDKTSWEHPGDPNKFYRVTDKNITAHSTDNLPSVVACTQQPPEQAAAEIAGLVRNLVDTGKVSDPNQVAFLFPSVKSKAAEILTTALDKQGLRVYSPRAGRFLEVQEPMDVFGIFLRIFGRPENKAFPGRDYEEYQNWLDKIGASADIICRQDKALEQFVNQCKNDIKAVISDNDLLKEAVVKHGWKFGQEYDGSAMKRTLLQTPGLSPLGKKSIENKFFETEVKKRLTIKEQDKTSPDTRPFTLGEVITRFSALTWNVLDLFHRLSGFKNFKRMYDIAQTTEKSRRDEGPLYNLGLISQYLAKFMEIYGASLVTAEFLKEDKFQRLFFMSFLYAIYRRGESEFEDEENPFPKGRIPFLTVHQAKGLEFPVVVLGSLRKDDKGIPVQEELIRFLFKKQGEPNDRVSEYDIARMFYVALSRAKNLLVLAHYKGSGYPSHHAFKEMFEQGIVRIPALDLNTVPEAHPDETATPKEYSYTADYLVYERCPRQYMVFRRYNIVPARSHVQFFGNLVHQTLEDLHLELIRRKKHAN